MKPSVRRILDAIPPSDPMEQILHPDRFTREGDRISGVDHDRQQVTVRLKAGAEVDVGIGVTAVHTAVYGEQGPIMLMNIEAISRKATWFEPPPKLPKLT